MLACCINYTASSLGLNTVNDSIWSQPESQANALKTKANQLKSEFDQANTEYHNAEQIGQHLVGNVQGRLRWLELLKAVNQCLPPIPTPTILPSRKPEGPPCRHILARDELHVTSLDCQQVDDVSTWYAGVKKWDPTAPSSDAAAGPTTPLAAPPLPAAGPNPLPAGPNPLPAGAGSAQGRADARRSRPLRPGDGRFLQRPQGAGLDRADQRLPLPQCRPRE